MNWYLIIGATVMVWTLLLIVSAERQRRLDEIRVKHIASERAKRQPKAPEVLTVG